MHSHFLQDLAVVMLVAGVVTIIFHRLKQPVVLGYILAGVIVGPHTPEVPLTIHDNQTIQILSELGVILLMFSLGLHFSLRKLIRVGPTASIAAVLEIAGMTAIGYALGRAFGWGWMDSLFLGAILAISSTTIIIKALAELGFRRERFAELVFGVLIVEDVLAIAMIALLSGIATTGQLAVGEVASTLGKLAVFLASVLIVGLLAIPRVLRYVSRFRSDEMLLVATLGLCFGISLLAAQLGYSVALGAFLAGAIVAEAREVGKLTALVEPVRDMFSAIFFVTIGMLINPAVLLQYAVPILLITVAVVIGKVLTCSLGAFLAGESPRTAMKVGMSLAQIGEFSFIIASLGQTLKVTSDFIYPIAVSVSAITTLLTPYLIRGSDPLSQSMSRIAPAWMSAPVALYHRWMTRPRSADPHEYVRAMLRKWTVLIIVNMLLVSGVLIASAAVSRYLAGRPAIFPAYSWSTDALILLVALLASLPLIVVTLQKVRAVAVILAEARLPRGGAISRDTLRAAMARTLRTAGSLVVIAWILILSIAIVPAWPLLLALLLFVTIVAFARRQHLENVYARVRRSLQETLDTPPAPAPGDGAAPATLAPIVRDAQVAVVTIPAGSPAAGKLIRELAFRTATGATIVAIEHGDASLLNPGPDEEIHAGDRVHLFGGPAQLEAAARLLEKVSNPLAEARVPQAPPA